MYCIKHWHVLNCACFRVRVNVAPPSPALNGDSPPPSPQQQEIKEDSEEKKPETEEKKSATPEPVNNNDEEINSSEKDEKLYDIPVGEFGVLVLFLYSNKYYRESTYFLNFSLFFDVQKETIYRSYINDLYIKEIKPHFYEPLSNILSLTNDS